MQTFPDRNPPDGSLRPTSSVDATGPKATFRGPVRGAVQGRGAAAVASASAPSPEPGVRSRPFATLTSRARAASPGTPPRAPRPDADVPWSQGADGIPYLVLHDLPPAAPWPEPRVGGERRTRLRIGLLALAFALGSAPALAGALTALRTLPAGHVIAEDDVGYDPAASSGVDDLAAVVGRAVRTAVYPGRPIQATVLAEPTLVQRNQIVTLRYSVGSLVIEAEGRSLGRGAAGETVRVLNTASKITLSARVEPDGALTVLPR